MRKRKQTAKAPTSKQYLAAAQRLFVRDGTLEIDEGAKISRGSDPGAYVQARVWVPDEEAKEEQP